ncbi:hypothetical protein [Xanthomonas oryzae]|uniref:hypothetical protein n=1 Tax=Xanthomonas oryzae TaxID=347 RepID=UPI0010346B66|nr:hypothetical protein [Xanthomonas oryzae]QBG97580.1 hypothetical protein EYC55_22400 [Xanthomonas oryzae]QBH01554.1 hypothetical protein EYC56_22830 [Xanthomonas oryzae]
MISEKSTPLVIDIAKSFTALVQGVAPDWRKGYLRFCSHNGFSESKASYVHPVGVEVVDVMQHMEFFNKATKKGKEVLAAIGKSEGVFLLIADSNFDYEIMFEYRDMDKWRISKTKGGNGVPIGLD